MILLHPACCWLVLFVWVAPCDGVRECAQETKLKLCIPTRLVPAPEGKATHRKLLHLLIPMSSPKYMIVQL